LATVIAAAQALRELVPGVRIRVIGRVDWSGMPVDCPRDPIYWAERGLDLVGTIPAADVPAALAGIDIGWIPFRDTANNRRTIPLKLLEYMAAGTPVVASDIGYIATIVRESGCGLLVPPDDVQGNVKALVALIEEPERAHRMGVAGRAAVRNRYTWAPEGQRLVALYHSLLSRAQPRSAR
jgi:glycosyltransferase involved in cell wall biosynthesis